MCCLFYFILHNAFFKGKSKSGIFVEFYCFFSGLLKKSSVFLFGSNSINTDDDYGRLVEFLSQILKLSCLIL